MKRCFLILLLALLSLGALRAQFMLSSSAGHTLVTGPGLNSDGVALFYTMPADAELRYTGQGSVLWSYTVGGQTFTSTQPTVPAEDGALYRVSVNGTPTYSLYALDYSRYLFVGDTILVSEDENTVCDSLTLTVRGTMPVITYRDRNDRPTVLPRRFTLDYETSAWSGTAWGDSAVSYTVVPASAPIVVTVAAPLRSTTFRFAGDSYLADMGLTPDTLYADYRAVALRAYPEGAVQERQAKNEKDRTSQGQIQGSAPLVVQFAANVNPVENPYVEWQIYNVKNPGAYQRFTDETLIYTFPETGEYVARFTARTDYCSVADSLNIKTMDSFLDVPNVFTPNGDGVNDEFRVAYRSLSEFTIWIYNRWGRLVYKGTDPGRGWDGTINGRPASVGTYYYVINAYGADEDYRGRRVHYRLSGDCNLLR